MSDSRIGGAIAVFHTQMMKMYMCCTVLNIVAYIIMVAITEGLHAPFIKLTFLGEI